MIYGFSLTAASPLLEMFLQLSHSDKIENKLEKLLNNTKDKKINSRFMDKFWSCWLVISSVFKKTIVVTIWVIRIQKKW